MSASWEKAVEQAAALGAAQRVMMIERGADPMVRDPRRIIMALFPMRADWQWPHPRMTLAELYAHADALIRLDPGAYGITAVESAREALGRLIAVKGVVEAARRTAA